MTATVRLIKVSHHIIDPEQDRVELFCDSCRRVVSTGRRYQFANGHDADQHMRLFHAAEDQGFDGRRSAR